MDINDTPQLFDTVISDINSCMATELTWLTNTFGRARKIVKVIDGKEYRIPAVYIGSGNYREMLPDSMLGNYSFFWIPDTQTLDARSRSSVRIKTNFSLIIWYDIRTIFADSNNTEAVKSQILTVLNTRLCIKSGSVMLTKISESAENIYREFTTTEASNQYMMFPFCGIRIDGEMTKTQDCINI